MPASAPAEIGQPFCIVVRAAWFEACRAAGLDTNAARAEALGVSRATVSRAQSGYPAGAGLVAGSLNLFGRDQFETLFQVRPYSALSIQRADGEGQ